MMPILNEPIADIFQLLQSGSSGLDDQEAQNRLKRYGQNSLEQNLAIGDIEAFGRQFLNPLVIILLVSAILSFFLGGVNGAIIIVIMVLLSVCLQFYHERRSSKAAAELSRQVAVHSSVLRNDRKLEIEITDIVPGDIVYLSAGDIVPGDSRLLEVNNLYVNQALLTGESYPVEKRVSQEAEASALITDMDYALFMGTSITSGIAKAIVVSTGRSTEIGKIAHTLTAKPPQTAFEHGIKDFSIMLLKMIFILVSLIFLMNAFMHKGFFESFLFAVAISVGLTPELLPMIMTINLANGAVRMAHKGVIVKWLGSIQNFGSMDILCSDKTGTLTEGEFKLIGYQDADGYQEDLIFLYAYLNSTMQGGMKNPLDLAIAAAGQPPRAAEFTKIGEVPFDFIRRMLSVIVKNASESIVIVKGAPESVLKHCTHYHQKGEIRPFSTTEVSQINKNFADASAQGYKVIAVAFKMVLPNQCDFSVEDEQDLVFCRYAVFL